MEKGARPETAGGVYDGHSCRMGTQVRYIMVDFLHLHLHFSHPGFFPAAVEN
jgi:hypothetical protein